MEAEEVLSQGVKQEYVEIARRLKTKGMDVRTAAVFGYDDFPQDFDICATMEKDLLVAGILRIQGNPSKVQEILEDVKLEAYGLRGDRVVTRKHSVGFSNFESGKGPRTYEKMEAAYREATGETFDESSGLVTLIGEKGDRTLFVTVGDLEVEKAENRQCHNIPDDLYHQRECSEKLEL